MLTVLYCPESNHNGKKKIGSACGSYTCTRPAAALLLSLALQVPKCQSKNLLKWETRSRSDLRQRSPHASLFSNFQQVGESGGADFCPQFIHCDHLVLPQCHGASTAPITIYQSLESILPFISSCSVHACT
ncbi:hypothetical protein BDA96_08G044800 [Sorghum bicolor]|uniref:Uncharacterized protein n=1 Tax=Sorghum bicolor TaxID=4558 RepID=A0A921U6Z0_SORBI|nr:hypothetical protein BDA96_08G044800 [Sorghum bicolor]